MDIAGYNSACNGLTARGRLAGITSLPLIFLCLYCNICLAFMPAKRYCEVGVAVLRHPPIIGSSEETVSSTPAS